MNYHQGKITQSNKMLSDWTKELIEAEAGLAREQGLFNACVEELQRRGKDQ
jgi:hypothetical protein